ncbi:serine hydrolase domain-containing protein [uncultured Bifidobacterium sp.]|uniref:serine hydrolase domain-containing protein n=1 Tax=uncultured Bifidobacterium sp. TaxID=165187 RepID=UPI00280ADACC|nr:serine hydrolase domain-containing protein [uncultured Bifidobacterium sp.]
MDDRTAVALFDDFVHYSNDRGLPIEGVAIGDESHIIAEHHFLSDRARSIYSHTKSYASTAIGIAIGDGLLTLDDTLDDVVDGDLPEDADPRIAQITLRDLLTMSSGFGDGFLMIPGRRAGEGCPDYLSYMLHKPVAVTPGKDFCYSSADTYLAGRMLEHVTGMRLGEYLWRRIFEPLGQGWPVWEHDPQGHAIGGSSIEMRLTEMMKIAQVFLNGGIWAPTGRRIVDAAWVAEATSRQIDTPPSNDDGWSCGYGYQWWLSPYPSAYRADGAYGQISTVLPEQGLVVAIQCPEGDGWERVVRHALHERLLMPLTT